MKYPIEYDIKVINRHHKLALSSDTPRMYCGRGSLLGNPFEIGKDYGNGILKRGEAIPLFARLIENHWMIPSSPIWQGLVQAAQALKSSGRLELECFCHPRPCHCDVIKTTLIYAMQMGLRRTEDWPPTCKCQKGKLSAWDGKCGHCRTNQDKKALRDLKDSLYSSPRGIRLVDPKDRPTFFLWGRSGTINPYECSTRGDRRLSAFNAQLLDGNSIEYHYQVNIKGYTSIKEGKGKPPIRPMSPAQQWQAYFLLWKRWADQHPKFIQSLLDQFEGMGIVTLTDLFANTDINQARALAIILNQGMRERYPDWDADAPSTDLIQLINCNR